MRVLVAMSGGVDSSVAAALLAEEGHEVVGATMKLWGGPSDTGCCSVADVEDARRVAQQLSIAHHVFNFTEQFDRDVVDPYVAAHASGQTPNPCVECNRHLKFDRFLDRADDLGFDAIATGHHARVAHEDGTWRLERGADGAKDQSYVLHMLGQDALARTLFPVGTMTKAEVRDHAARLGLRTAAKPDSQDVCFISRTGGRETFLGDRIPLSPATVVDLEGREVGSVDAVQLVTVGQRRGLGAISAAGAASSTGGASSPGAPTGGSTSAAGVGTGVGEASSHRSPTKADRRYALEVDVAAGRVTVGSLDDLMVDHIEIRDVTWTDEPLAAGAGVRVQVSAHGAPFAARWLGNGVIGCDEPVRRVAPGQSVVFYNGDAVAGGGLAV